MQEHTHAHTYTPSTHILYAFCRIKKKIIRELKHTLMCYVMIMLLLEPIKSISFHIICITARVLHTSVTSLIVLCRLLSFSVSHSSQFVILYSCCMCFICTYVYPLCDSLQFSICMRQYRLFIHFHLV